VDNSEETIFTRIIRGEIPCHKIYEDDKTFAFLDITPIQPGHVLVVSKKPYKTFEVMGDEDYTALMKTVKLIARRIKQVFKPRRVGIIVEGFEVDHAHVKILPINNEAELRNIPDPHDRPTDEELEKVAQKLRQ